MEFDADGMPVDLLPSTKAALGGSNSSRRDGTLGSSSGSAANGSSGALGWGSSDAEAEAQKLRSRLQAVEIVS